jgi:hypothetical protein
MKRLLIQEQWNGFARAVLPSDASAVQRTEMRRAFYGGAHALLCLVMNSLAPEAEPTPEDLRFIADLHQELEDFKDRVKQGRA